MRHRRLSTSYLTSLHLVVERSLSNHCSDRFFRNKGAVAGVFLIVGLAAASIVLFMIFYIRRRRRTQRLEHDTAVASTLAAAGYNRQPLDGDDDDEKGHRRTSAPSAVGTLQNSSFGSGAMLVGSTAGARPPTAEGNTAPSTPGTGLDYDPYAAYGTVHPPPAAVFPAQTRRDGYMPARTGSPPPGAYNTRRHTHSTSTSASSMGYGHAAKASIGSTEPLLSGYYSGVPTEPPTPALGPTLNLASPAGGEAERPRGGVAERGSTTTTTSSVYSADDESEIPEMKPKLEVCVPDVVSVDLRSRVVIGPEQDAG